MVGDPLSGYFDTKQILWFHEVRLRLTQTGPEHHTTTTMSDCWYDDVLPKGLLNISPSCWDHDYFHIVESLT